MAFLGQGKMMESGKSSQELPAYKWWQGPRGRQGFASCSQSQSLRGVAWESPAQESGTSLGRAGLDGLFGWGPGAEMSSWAMSRVGNAPGGAGRNSPSHQSPQAMAVCLGWAPATFILQPQPPPLLKLLGTGTNRLQHLLNLLGCW